MQCVLAISICLPLVSATQSSLSSFNLFTFPIDNPQIHLMLPLCTKEYNRPQGREQSVSNHVLPPQSLAASSPFKGGGGLGAPPLPLLEF